MKDRACSCLLAAAVLLSASPVRGAQTEAVTIPFPRGASASVGLTNGPMLIRSDKTLMRWVFQVANAGRRDWHARIRVRVYSADERLLASNDREGEVDARDWHDRITVWTRIRTLDYPRADHVRVEAVFYPD